MRLNFREQVKKTKTYCKPAKVNIYDPEFNRIAVHQAFVEKRTKPEFFWLLVDMGGITPNELREEIREGTWTKTNAAIDQVCDVLTQCIADGDLQIPPIYTFHRREGTNQKLRELNSESSVQQVYEYIAKHALDELFRVKILPCQYGSIPGAGQIKGKAKIEQLLRRKFGGQVTCVKCDLAHAYQSVTVSCVMQYLRRDIGKNKPLLAFLEQLMSNYPDGRLMIGGYLPTWLFNYIMSYLLREVMSYTHTRRGRKIRLVLAVVCYADDFLLFGHRSNLHRAAKRVTRWAAGIGLTVKRPYSVYQVMRGYHRVCGVDMMGFRVFDSCTIIRRRVFKRLRRQYLRAARDLNLTGHIPYWRAYKIASYHGVLKHTDSLGFSGRYNTAAIMRAAKISISRKARVKL